MVRFAEMFEQFRCFAGELELEMDAVEETTSVTGCVATVGDGTGGRTGAGPARNAWAIKGKATEKKTVTNLNFIVFPRDLRARPVWSSHGCP